MAVYLTFLIDLSNETRLLESTLRFVPDPARVPEGPNIWKVTCDAKGHVYVRAIDDGKLVLKATARWSGRLTDRAEKVDVSDKQWDRIEHALEAASAKRKADPSPYDDSLVERADGGPLLPLRAFLLDVNTGIVGGSIRDSNDNDLAPTSDAVWKVTCLENGEVSLQMLAKGMVVALATASWDGNALSYKRIATSQVGAAQWRLVENALRDAALVPASPRAPVPEDPNAIAFQLDVDGDGAGDLRVTCDEHGLVTVVSTDEKTRATARWDGAKLDGKLIAKGQLAAMQWNDIAVELHAAKVASVMDAQADDHLMFLLVMALESPPSPVLLAPNEAPLLAPNTWKVRMDRAGTIAVVALVDDQLAMVATAHWSDGKLRAKNVKRGPISKEQWAHLKAAIPIAMRAFEATRASALDATRLPFVPTPYVTFLVNLADGDLVVDGSLRFVPDPDRQPTVASEWKVASDANGKVWIWSRLKLLVGNATWNGMLIDRTQSADAVPTDAQWEKVQQALALAFERRAQDPTPIDWSLVEPIAPAPPPAPPPTAPPPAAPDPIGYRAFLFDIRSGEMVDGSLHFAPDSRETPERVFVWKVILDGDRVEILDNEMASIATATFDGGAFVDTRQPGTLVTDTHWRALRRELVRARCVPTPAEATAMVSPSRTKEQPYRLGLVILGLMAATGLAFIVVGLAKKSSSETPSSVATSSPPPVRIDAAAPSPPPPPPPLTKEERIASAIDLPQAVRMANADQTLVANYRVRWSELDVPSQTTIAQVEKEPAEEVGKFLCVEGLITSIYRRDLANKRHYWATLETPQGDHVKLTIAGSSGTLVKRQEARACGVVLGATNGETDLFGMFDLPENRNPVVERAE